MIPPPDTSRINLLIKHASTLPVRPVIPTIKGWEQNGRPTPGYLPSTPPSYDIIPKSFPEEDVEEKTFSGCADRGISTSHNLLRHPAFSANYLLSLLSFLSLSFLSFLYVPKRALSPLGRCAFQEEGSWRFFAPRGVLAL
jgi:hypothetical protein